MAHNGFESKMHGMVAQRFESFVVQITSTFVVAVPFFDSCHYAQRARFDAVESVTLGRSNDPP